MRRLLHTLGRKSVWSSPGCRSTVEHVLLRPRPPPEPPPDRHYAIHWDDVSPEIFRIFTTQHKLWVWVPEGEALQLLPDLHCFGTAYKFALLCTAPALSALSGSHHQRLTLLFKEHGTCNHLVATPPHSDHFFRRLLFQMKQALRDTNLGRWARLMQSSTPFGPCTTLPSLRTIRRKAHTVDCQWFVHVPPPTFLVYACINSWTGSMYLGQTT